jgi:hypothetical protein
MDITNSLILAYGGFGDEINDEILIEKNVLDINDITKIIKYNDYKNHHITKINNCDCSICLEEFDKNETTNLEIIKLIEEYKIKKYLEKFNYEYTYELDKNETIDKMFENKKIPNDICIISCLHIFHKKCILEWYEKKNYSCPLCRKNLKIIK